MKLFTKLALVAAIGTSGSAFALQSMDDAALAETTGQDGITILIALPSNVLNIDQLAIFDNGGFTGAAESGAIVFGKNAARGAALGSAPTVGTGVSITTNGPIQLGIDASGGGAAAATTGTAPVLNIAVTLPSTFTIATGDVSVVGAQGAAGAQQVDTDTASPVAKILNSMSIGLGGASLNIQLGNPTQGAMIVASGTITGGLNIANFGLVDGLSSMGGTLGIANIKLTGGSAAATTAGNLALSAKIDIATATSLASAGFTGATAGALLVTMGSATAGSAKYNAYLQGVSFGAATPVAGETMGDVRITGMDLTGAKIAIQGR